MTALRIIDGNGFTPDEGHRGAFDLSGLPDYVAGSDAWFRNRLAEATDTLASIRESLGRIFEELASIGRQVEELERRVA